MNNTPILSFTGYSNSGKTTLIRKILEKLSGEYSIAVIKHHGHISNNESSFKKKDTMLFKEAGARDVRLVIGDASPDDIIKEFHERDFDLIIIEGFKHESYPKFYIKRENIRKIDYNIDSLIGIISDDISDSAISNVWFHIDDVDNIVDFIKIRFLKGD